MIGGEILYLECHYIRIYPRTSLEHSKRSITCLRQSVSTSVPPTQSSRSSKAASPSSSRTPKAVRTTPSVVAFSKTGEVLVGEVAKRQAITNPDRTFRSCEAPHGRGLEVRRHRRQAVHRTGNQRPHTDEAQARRRELPGRHGHPGGHHRARVLRRRTAHRHQGSRHDRRPRSAPHHQRADRSRARLRPRQGEEDEDHPRVRPRWRHVRRVGPRDRRRRVRGQVDARRHRPRWRRLGPAHHRLARPAVQGDQGVDLSATAWPASA